jgi:hypothetical protein
MTVMHQSAVLTGGTVPEHVPGAYPNLSCCGGPVQLVSVRVSERALASLARREGRRWTSSLYSTKLSIAYGLDGLYGYPGATQHRDELEAGARRFTPGYAPMDEDR